jgi:hypothetical protein
VRLRLLFGLGMVIELGTPHPTYLPDEARSFVPNKCAPSECFCRSALAVFSGNVRSTETRFFWITAIQPRNHLANSLFSSVLGGMDPPLARRPASSLSLNMSRQETPGNWQSYLFLGIAPEYQP